MMNRQQEHLQTMVMKTELSISRDYFDYLYYLFMKVAPIATRTSFPGNLIFRCDSSYHYYFTQIWESKPETLLAEVVVVTILQIRINLINYWILNCQKRIHSYRCCSQEHHGAIVIGQAPALPPCSNLFIPLKSAFSISRFSRDSIFALNSH